MGKIGPDAEPAIPVLIKLVAGDGGTESTAAVIALGTIGKAAVDPLVKLLKHERQFVRERAAKALGLIGPDAKSAVGALKNTLRDKSGMVRMYAETALKQINRKSSATRR